MSSEWFSTNFKKNHTVRSSAKRGQTKFHAMDEKMCVLFIKYVVLWSILSNDTIRWTVFDNQEILLNQSYSLGSFPSNIEDDYTSWICLLFEILSVLVLQLLYRYLKPTLCIFRKLAKIFKKRPNRTLRSIMSFRIKKPQIITF